VSGGDIRGTVAWVAAGVLVGAGAIAILVGVFSPAATASFGWFAYQPLSGATFVPGGTSVVLSRVTAVGFTLATIGLIGLAFLTGRVAGRRSRE
jgi:heme/copper-type cytochrome/quinol oxidase subunit 1